MILKIAYCPFAACQELKDMAAAVVKSHNSVHRFDRFDPALRTPADGSTVLAGVASYQQLYIFAHGFTGNDRVYNGANAGLTVTELALQLKGQGLPLSIKKIKLWVCNAGTVDGAGASTANYFKRAMMGEMYTNVQVFGYSLCLGTGLNAGKHKVGVFEDAVVRVNAAKQAVVEAARSTKREAISEDDLDALMNGKAVAEVTRLPVDPGTGRFREIEKVSAKQIRHKF